ncbi:MAG TPA: endo-1,4-beta-xylanase [Bryobacteraceae bacterium]|nr:endo-1,4-beta-xylanase [Bryobacteraceae bacterium]
MLIAVVLAAPAAPLGAQTSLRQAAAMRAILIGAAASAGDYGPPDLLQNSSYANLLSTQYSMLEPGNAMKWDVTQPTQTTYNFQPGDELVAFAQTNGMRVRGHTLCWHNQLPSWLPPYAATATPADMATLLQDHIATVVTHFKGQVFAWDVVNEAFDDSPTPALRDSIWYNQPGIGQTGTGYIEQAFRWAHDADPSALLFYNDYGIEGQTPKFAAVLNMAQDFVNRGVPISGVGFQMHLALGGYPSATDLAQNMQALAALGLQVHITEMDVRVPVDSSGNASAANLAAQAQMYQTIMTVCLAQPNCTAFQVWGVSYNDSWIPSVFPGFGAALPFDFNYNPTPAFSALMTALQTTPPVLQANRVVSAASYQGQAVAPGEIVAIFGANYGPPSLVLNQVYSNKFSTGVSGAQVLFDGVPAPMIYALAGQVSAIVPFEVAGRQHTVVQYTYDPGNGALVSNTVTVPVVDALPGIFSLDASGSGPGAILNVDYSVNSASNPVAANGAVLVYCTGGGAVVGGATDGGLAPGIGSLVTTPVTATIGGLPAKVLYSGPAPGLVNGVVQVNLQVPSGLAPGPQPVVITIGTASSQKGITVAVQ